MIFPFFFLFFIGCANLADTSPVDVPTAVGTATVVKVVEKVKEVFSPKYPLLANPSEICDITTDPVTCYVVPCAGGECSKKTQRDQWISENPKVVTIETSMVPEIVKFCQKNERACEEYAGHYKGSKIILVKE